MRRFSNFLKEEADAVRLQADCKTELPRLREKVKELEDNARSDRVGMWSDVS